MKMVLSELRPQLEASAKETTDTMEKIETENVSVEKARIMVKRDENAANVQAKIAMSLKTECEADLAEALPALEDAIGAYNSTTSTRETLRKAVRAQWSDRYAYGKCVPMVNTPAHE